MSFSKNVETFLIVLKEEREFITSMLKLIPILFFILFVLAFIHYNKVRVDEIDELKGIAIQNLFTIFKEVDKLSEKVDNLSKSFFYHLLETASDGVHQDIEIITIETEEDEMVLIENFGDEKTYNLIKRLFNVIETLDNDPKGEILFLDLEKVVGKENIEKFVRLKRLKNTERYFTIPDYIEKYRKDIGEMLK